MGFPETFEYLNLSHILYLNDNSTLCNFISLSLNKLSVYKPYTFHMEYIIRYTLRENNPNTEFFLVRIQENTNQKKLRIWILFTVIKVVSWTNGLLKWYIASQKISVENVTTNFLFVGLCKTRRTYMRRYFWLSSIDIQSCRHFKIHSLFLEELD